MRKQSKIIFYAGIVLVWQECLRDGTVRGQKDPKDFTVSRRNQNGGYYGGRRCTQIHP